MKQVFYVIIAGYLAVQLLACSQQRNANPGSAASATYTLEEAGSKTFPLDSVSLVRGSQIQIVPAYCPTCSNYQLAMLNKHTNQIYFYDYTQPNKITKLSFDAQGPNGIGGNATGMYVHNPDSVFVHNYAQAKLFLYGKDGRQLAAYPLQNPQTPKLPMVNEAMPVYLKNELLHFNCWGSDELYQKNKNLKPDLVLQINPATKQKTYAVAYPACFNKAIWGVQFHVMYSAFNPNTRHEMFSFANDDSLTVRDANNRLLRYPTPSRFVEKIKPLSNQEKLNYIPKVDDEVRNQITQATFGPVYTDPYTGFSYRFVQKALTQEQFKNKTPERGWKQDFSLLLLDPQYRKVGEVDFPYRYSISKIFFTPEGLHILDENTPDDQMRFTVFRLKKL